MDMEGKFSWLEKCRVKEKKGNSGKFRNVGERAGKEKRLGFYSGLGGAVGRNDGQIMEF